MLLARQSGSPTKYRGHPSWNQQVFLLIANEVCEVYQMYNKQGQHENNGWPVCRSDRQCTAWLSILRCFRWTRFAVRSLDALWGQLLCDNVKEYRYPETLHKNPTDNLHARLWELRNQGPGKYLLSSHQKLLMYWCPPWYSSRVVRPHGKAREWQIEKWHCCKPLHLVKMHRWQKGGLKERHGGLCSQTQRSPPGAGAHVLPLHSIEKLRLLYIENLHEKAHWSMQKAVCEIVTQISNTPP